MYNKLFFKIALSLFLSLCSMHNFAQNSFDIIALGTGGGVDESNLSSYLVSVSDMDKYIALDAGTLMYGLKLASDKGHFNHLKSEALNTEANVLLNHIDAYCISHPHLDHIMGMLIAAPFDNHKTILGSNQTIDALMNHIFLSPLWGNFTTEGNENGKWDLLRMKEKDWYDIPNNELKIKYYSLCHSCPNESSAFLIKNKDSYLLYFGDTGADRIEKSDKMQLVFQDMVSLIKKDQLKAIFLEASFPNDRKDNLLFGHLTPDLMEEALSKLATMISPKNPEDALKGIKLFITHLKPDFKKQNDSKSIIQKEIKLMNSYGAETIVIKQSEKYKI